MGTKQVTRRVTDCEHCPFEYDSFCTYEDPMMDAEHDVSGYRHTVPRWCPLRKSAVKIVLHLTRRAIGVP